MFKPTQPSQLFFEGNDHNTACNLVEDINKKLARRENFDPRFMVAEYTFGYAISRKIRLFIKEAFAHYWQVTFKNGKPCRDGNETIITLAAKTSVEDITTYLS